MDLSPLPRLRATRPRVRQGVRLLAACALCCAVLACLAHPARAQDHRGGTLRLLSTAAAGSIDPQINYTGQYWQLFTVVYDGLVGFRRVAGPDGLQMVPDLAEALPTVSADGLTYRFTLRDGVRFSDGAPVRASDAAASLRRIFRVISPTGGSFYGAIEGAAECLRQPRDCTLPGVGADDATRTLTLHLVRPDPELLMKLALPHASVLPASAPDHDAGGVAIPGTGPYRFVRYDPASTLRLERNAQFHPWNPDAQPDGNPDAIEYRFGLEDEAEVTQVENGQADWMFEGPPLDRLAELGAAYASQVHVTPALALWFLPMNSHEPPFDDPQVRRAVAMAVDRDAVVKLFGGPKLASPSCQILPPGLAGHEPFCPVPHDPAAARRLVAASGRAGQVVTLVVDTSAVSRSIGTYLLGVLQDLGFQARLRPLSNNLQFTYIQNTANHVQISLTVWYDDYPAASDFLPVLFGCAAFHPGTDSSVNFSGFCDPALDRQMQAAASPSDWAAIDRAITEQSLFAVLFNPRYIDVTSARVQNFFYHEQYHWLLAQSWLR